MKWDEIGSLRCSIARSLAVVGDRWTLLIVRDAFLGVHRFDDFQRSLGLSRHRLSDRLAKLTQHGILERRAYQQRPERFEYRLTEKGIDLYPVLLAIVGWGDRWLAGEDGPPVRYEHRSCGHIGLPTLHCTECGDAVGARDIVPHLSRVRPDV